MTPRPLQFLVLAVACVTALFTARAAELTETFSTNPLTRGWQVAGDASLFTWNPTTAAVDVTWDSSRTNSFFYLPLPAILTKAQDFKLSFSVRLQDIRIGSTPGKPAEFPIAVGLLHRRLISTTNAFRGAGVSTLNGVRNIAEWNFFPDGGFGDTWATTVISSNNVFAFGHTFPLALTPGDTYRITLAYTASNQILATTGLRNNQTVGPLESVWLGGTPDFRLDAISITSYSDAGQPGPEIYRGSVLAHGTVDDVVATLPPAPTGPAALTFSNGGARVVFGSHSNWVHTLERSLNLRDWAAAGPTVVGTGSQVTLQDTNPASPAAFYRVRSDRP